MNNNECNGYCICVYCNIKVLHSKGVPCRENVCAFCGNKMMKEGSYHHQLYVLKKKENNLETTT